MTKIRNLFARMEKRRKERRTKSRYADDKAVDEFTRVVDKTRILTEQQCINEAAKTIANENPSMNDIERLGELLNGLPKS